MSTKKKLKTTINLEINHAVEVTNNTIIIGTGFREIIIDETMIQCQGNSK